MKNAETSAKDKSAKIYQTNRDTATIDNRLNSVNKAYAAYEKTYGKKVPKSITEAVNELQTGAKTGVLNANQVASQAETIKNALGELGVQSQTTFNSVAKLFQTHFKTQFVMGMINSVQRGLRDIVTQVSEVDKAMTELKKVTEQTDSGYDNILNQSSRTATEIGTQVNDVVSATADFLRLGFEVPESQGLAKAALMYKNIGYGINTVEDATESLTSTIKAFDDIDGADAMEVIDKFNEVGNNYAIGSAGIGEALKRSASSLATANNDLDQSIALVTAANEVIQNPEKVGTSLKTTSMRLRTKDTRTKLSDLAGIDTMSDPNTYKSTFQILQEISKVWDKLTDKNQADILQQISGKANANAIAGLIKNFSQAEKAMKTSQTASGSAEEANKKYLDSIEGKTAQLKAQWQEFALSVLDSDLFKGVLSVVTQLLKLITSINEASHGLMSAAAIGFGFNKILGIIGKVKTFAGLSTGITTT